MAANQGASTSSAASSGTAQEFIVRVPKADKKRYHVMKFNASHKIEFGKWSQARLERENNFKEFKPGEEMPKFGAGSEYGRENREEARKKKYGIKASKRKLDDQPWCLRVGGKAGKKYRGIREGGVTENASYYVFTQAPDGAFEAFPIEEWYNFTPVRTYRTLNAEEAEEEFGKRDKVFNYFSIMMKKRLKNEDPDVDPDGEEKSKKGTKKKPKSGDFKISEMDDWVNSSDDEEDEDDEDETEGKDKNKPPAEKNKGKKKPGPAKKGAKKKKKGKESDDSEALEDSDDGDDEGREVDYFSDESSESDADEERGGKGNRDALKGVEDEEAIRKMEDSESEDEDGVNKKDAAALEDAVKDEGSVGTPAASGSGSKEKEKPAAKDKKEKKTGGSSSSSSSDTSDSDDFDNDTSFQTPLFMQDKITGSSKKQSKKSKKEHAAANKSNTTKTKAAEKGGLKRVAGESEMKEASTSKRIKLENQASSSSSPSVGSSISIDGISEDSIRRYLMRKPLTASELLQKFKSKKTGLSSEHLVNTIAQILKRLNPDKQTVKGKMYLSIRP